MSKKQVKWLEEEISKQEYIEVERKWYCGSVEDFLYEYKSASSQYHDENCQFLKKLRNIIDSSMAEDLRDMSWITPVRFMKVWESSLELHKPQKWHSTAFDNWFSFDDEVKSTIHILMEVSDAEFVVHYRYGLRNVNVLRGRGNFELGSKKLYKTKFKDFFGYVEWLNGSTGSVTVIMEANSAVDLYFKPYGDESQQVILHAVS